MIVETQTAVPRRLSPEQCETARLSRDPRFDGRFFVAVLSTRIYCRPICPVQPPLAKNVRFYRTAAEAAEAGFRPCLRCRPEAAPGSPAWIGASAVVGRALRLINEGALDRQRLPELAARLGMTSRHLNRLFSRFVGASPGTVARTRRLHFAKRLLDDTDIAIGEIALAAGYGSVRRFNDEFRKVYGRAPREVRRLLTAPRQTDEFRLNLRYRPPFDWSSLLEFFRQRAIPGIEQVSRDCYTRSVNAGDKGGWFSITRNEKDSMLELALHGVEPGMLMYWVRRVRQQFDLDCDPRELAAFFKADDMLGRAWKDHGGLRIPGSVDFFETAVRAIVGQQISVAAARTLCGRIVNRYGARLELEKAPLEKVFPSAEKLQRARLEKLGIVPQRARAIRALAKVLATRNVDVLTDDPDATCEALLEIPGIGPWTVEYVRMRSLGDPDAFPVEDIVIRDWLGERLANGQRLSCVATRERAGIWQPWRAYAAILIWKLVASRRKKS